MSEAQNSSVIDEIRFAVQVSRPGLWLTSVWFYCLPVAGHDAFASPRFWLGAFFVTFPMGYMIYGWNDAVDFDTDQRNPRKGSYLFGAQGSREQLSRLPRRIVLVELPFLFLFVWLVGPKVLWLGVAGIVVSGLYNFAFKGLPPFEILNQFGYVLVLVFSSWLNGVPVLSWEVFVFGGLFAMHAHVFGEILDIEPDRAVGRRTTAVVLGRVRSKLLVAGMLGFEAAFVYIVFREPILTGFLGLAALVFVADALMLWRNRPYALGQIRAIMILWNLAAAALLGYLWTTAALR